MTSIATVGSNEYDFGNIASATATKNIDPQILNDLKVFE